MDRLVAEAGGNVRRILDFYQPLLYDLAAGDADPSPDTVAFYLGKAGPLPRRVLDIGAGTGRLAVPLFQRGHSVICVDQSEAMLEALRRRADGMSRADACRFRFLRGPFTARGKEPRADVAFAMDDFLLHLTTPDDLRAFFRDLSSWLDVEGLFVTDIRPRCSADFFQTSKPVALKTFGITPDARTTVQDQLYCTVFWEEYDSGTQALLTTCQYQVLSFDGVVVKTYYRVLQQRIHTNTEVVQAAADARFRLVQLSSRNQPGIPPESDIGGSFEFRLDG